MIYQQEGGIKLTKITLAAARVNAGNDFTGGKP